MASTRRTCALGRHRPVHGRPARTLLSIGAAVSLSLVMVCCGRQATSPKAPHPAASRAPLSAALQATALATSFMKEMLNGDFGAQWPQLAAVAQHQWPSEAARNTMLAAKFTGSAQVASFSLGAAVPGAAWTSRETPASTLANVYSVRAGVQFRDPSKVLPPGVVADYQGLSLALAAVGTAHPGSNGGAGAMRIVGEGPMSPNAPIIQPTPLISRQAAVPILMYHLVGPYPIRANYTNQYSYQIDYGLTVPPAQFAAEMGYLVSQHYTSISLVDLADYLYYGLPLPPKPVVITFDDGFANEYRYALPVLQANGLTATFLPCSGLIGIKNGQEYYMTAAELKDLASSGMWVEDHTYNDGTVLWGRSPATIQALAGNTAKVLEQITGQPIQFISYSGLWPYPSPQTVATGERELFSELSSLGYVGGLEDNWLGRFPWLESSNNLWELPRVRSYPGEPLSVFAGLLNYG